MQPTVRRARRTADTRGYAHRERAARWGRPRPEHPPGFVEIAGCGLEERGPDQLPSLTRTQLGPNHAFLSVLIREHRLGRRVESHGSQRIRTDHSPEPGDGGRSENPGVGGSIPSQPTIHFKQLPVTEFSLR